METPPTLNEAQQKERIRDLNDLLRKTFIGGKVLITQGIQSLPAASRQEILKQIRAFDNFTPDNDPYGEHDFGALEHEGKKIFWKVDAYDKNLEFGSDAPWNTTETQRVLTIMLAEEY